MFVCLLPCLLDNRRTGSLGIDTTKEMRMGSLPPDTFPRPCPGGSFARVKGLAGEVCPHAEAKMVSERTNYLR